MTQPSANSSGAVLSNIENTAVVARLAGFTGKALVTIVAIAGCESNWNPSAVNNNPSTGDYSVGLFQINYFGSLLGPRTAAYGSPSQLQSDPMAQAKAAYSVSGGGANFTPWTTYTSGCYLQNLPAATAAVAATSGYGADATTWANGASGATLTAANSSGSGSGSSDNNCIVKAPGLNLFVTKVGGGCLLSQSNARALLGGVTIAGGALIMLAAVALIAGKSTVVKQGLATAGPVGNAVSYIAKKVPDRNDRRAMSAPETKRDSKYRAAKNGVKYNQYGEEMF
jgi:hypothetical protein